MQRHPALAGLDVVALRDAVVDEPGEDVADAGLAGFISPTAVEDAAVYYSAHSGNFAQHIGIHHMARRGAHDRNQLSRIQGIGRGHGDVGIDVADGDGDPRWEPGPFGGLRGERTGAVAELAQRLIQLLGDEVGEVRVDRGEKLPRRILAVLANALVARAARIADVGARQLPHDPVGGLDPAVDGLIHLRVLLQDFQRLRKLPFAGDQPAVTGQPRLTALGGNGIDAVGLRLRRVMSPQLDVCVGPIGELFQLAQRGAVAEHRHHRAGGEVGADADHVGGIDAGARHRLRDGGAQHVDVVRGDLQRPLAGQPDARAAG